MSPLSPATLAAWRAGIEAAAQWHDNLGSWNQRRALDTKKGTDESRAYWSEIAYFHHESASAIRAIPPPAAVASPWQPGTCSTCAFRRGSDCRRSPPVRLPRMFADTATAGNRVRDESLLWDWPQVPHDGWCSEYMPLPAPPARPDARPTPEEG